MTLKYKLIIGLGNPGDEYRQTYHNAGALFIEYLSKQDSKTENFKPNSSKLFRYLKRGDEIFVLPEVFMNESGRAIKDALNYFNVKPEEALICHDDSDIKIGEYKIAFEQSSAGHKGVDSIIKTLNTDKFWRLRIGIRPPEEKVRQKAEDFVLKKISPANLEKLELTFQKAAKEIKN